MFAWNDLYAISKIRLPDYLLAKSRTQMSGEDLGAYRKHPAKGQQALKSLHELREAASGKRSAHPPLCAHDPSRFF